MKTCINGATTMPYPLEEDIEAAGKIGFEGIEIWKEKLENFLARKEVEDLKKFLSSYNLKVPAICALGGYIWGSEEEFKNKIEETRHYFEVANEINCSSLVVVSEWPKNKNIDEVIEAHVSRLTRLAEIGENYDVKIAMEWFWNHRDAFKVIEEAKHKYLGLVVDTFHWYRGNGNLNNLSLIPRDKLFLVHINDCENLSREKLTDKNRLYCGLGVIPLKEVLHKFKQAGYQGYLSVEIFRDEYWKKDPITISRESLETLKKVMMEASVL